MRCVLLFLAGVIGTALIYLLVLWISSLFVSRKKLYDKEQPFYRWLLHSVCWISLVFGNVRIRRESLEVIPEGPVLFICNHRSNYDPIVLEWILRRKKRNTFITKPENFLIFVIGQIARRNCCIPINREHPRMALEAIRRAVDLIENEQFSVTVFPEGTRSRSGQILEFHNGIFKIAKTAGTPLVAFYLDGTQKIAENMPWKKSVVTVRIADILSAEELKDMSTVQIGQRIRNRYLELHGEGTSDEE